MPWRFHIFSKTKLGRKIFATMAIFIAVISFSFTLYFIRYQGQTLTANLVAEGKLLAGILAYNARIGVFSENREMLKGPLESVLKYDNVIEVSVFNLGWELLARLQTVKYGHQPPAEDPGAESRDGIANRLAQSRQPFYAEGEDRFAFWSPVSSSAVFGEEETLLGEKTQSKDENRLIGFVRVTLDKSALNKNLRALLLRSILIAAAFLVLGSAISYLVVQKITTPLNRLTERVLALGRGGVVEQVPVETADEVGNLARAFNTLSEALKRREMEKAQLEEHLRHAQKMEAIGTLAGGIAHDFNNILGAIMGYTELALFSAPEGSSLRRYLDELLKASNRAKDLVNQILTFSRQREKERKPVRLAGIVEETLKMLRASLPSTIEIRQHLQEDLGPVLCDPTQIHQVVMNLCTNARHAMRAKGGVLEISLSTMEIDAKRATRHLEMKAGRYQKLSVSDTGHGMDRAVLERIFDPFFTTKGPGEGTGMGLAVVHGIVRDHGGLLTVRSEPRCGDGVRRFLSGLGSGSGPGNSPRRRTAPGKRTHSVRGR